MRKIKLKPLAVVNNLTPQEMKDVKGGVIDYLCSCVIMDYSYQVVPYTDNHHTSAAITAESCDARCSATCFDFTSCSDYSFFFSAGGTQ